MESGRVLAERYELVRPLAEGAMSTVWVARDQTSGEEVAIKSISLDAAGWRAEVRDRFTKEARLLALGKHDHLVGVRDVGETDDGFLFLVLDLLHGETLADRIARSPEGMDWKEATELALAVMRGVSALHRAGIVHRDLKPANVVLHVTKEGTVPKIIDLGISKVRAAAADPALCATLTATGQVLGTPQYMSHEQALGEPDVDTRTDVWALGVILYEMLAGRRPFEAPNANAVLAAIRRKEAPALAEVAKGVPVAIAGVVERCLRIERAERYADAGELSEALHAAIEAARVDPTPAVVAEAAKPERASAPKPAPVPPLRSPRKPPPEAPPVSRRAPPPRSRSIVPFFVAFVVIAPLAFFLVRSRAPKPNTQTSVPLATETDNAPTPAQSNVASPYVGAVDVRSTSDKSSVVPATTRATNPGSPGSSRSAPITTKTSRPITSVNEAGF